LLTFIGAAGFSVGPTFRGATKGLMVGNLVATQILASQNLPLGAAMAVLLILCLALLVAVAGTLLWSVRRLILVYRGAAV
jgi:spermidine/putrescine transport system permease protein